MKTLKKVIINFSIGIFIVFALIIGLSYYLQKSNECEPFQTVFLGKDIRFPINLIDATKKYNLSSDGIRGIMLSEKDTLMIAEKNHPYDDLFCIVFYLREVPPNDINEIKKTFEKQFKSKFVSNPILHSSEYMKISDCTYLLINSNEYSIDDIFYRFTKKKTHLTHKKITCRIGFYYKISETALFATSEDGWIGTFPSNFDRKP